MTRTAGGTLRLFAPALAVLVVDQASKAWVATALPFGSGVAVAPFFNLVHTRNTGAAFSMLADAGGWQRYFFLVLALLVSVWISTMLVRHAMRACERWAYSLIMGGALGNAVDRARKGAVTDFLDLHAFGSHWPAFNVADIGITAGAALLVWSAVRGGSPQPRL